MTQVALTAISSNRKTGAIPTTTSEKATCPDSCPFKAKGCYAKGGPQNLHWQKVTEKKRGTHWDSFVGKIHKLPYGQLWRHNVSGDLPHSDGLIQSKLVNQLVRANKGRKGFTYTHHQLNDHNLQVLKNANQNGFTINISTESIEVADSVMTKLGLPAVAVVPSSHTERFYRTQSGRKVITCPATIHDNVTCATCQLCSKADRNFIIAFPAHGNAKKTVNRIVTV